MVEIKENAVELATGICNFIQKLKVNLSSSAMK